MCVEYIEREGLDAEGLYRVPGNRAHVDLLFAKFDDDKVRPGPHLDKYKRTSVSGKGNRPVLESMNILWCVLIFLNLTCPLTRNSGIGRFDILCKNFSSGYQLPRTYPGFLGTGCSRLMFLFIILMAFIFEPMLKIRVINAQTFKTIPYVVYFSPVQNTLSKQRMHYKPVFLMRLSES